MNKNIHFDGVCTLAISDRDGPLVFFVVHGRQSTIREHRFTTHIEHVDGERRNDMSHVFDARDLPSRYRADPEDRPVHWVRRAIDDGYDVDALCPYRGF